jgi:hypothetical protein
MPRAKKVSTVKKMNSTPPGKRAQEDDGQRRAEIAAELFAGDRQDLSAFTTRLLRGLAR